MLLFTYRQRNTIQNKDINMQSTMILLEELVTKIALYYGYFDYFEVQLQRMKLFIIMKERKRVELNTHSTYLNHTTLRSKLIRFN